MFKCVTYKYKGYNRIKMKINTYTFSKDLEV